MKKSVWVFSIAAVLCIGAFTGCKTRKTGPIDKNNPVPVNVSNNDSTGTTPGVNLTPAPIPNTRPNPIPNPQPPNPPM